MLNFCRPHAQKLHNPPDLSIHSDKKNFACHVCGRGFTRMQRLREHSARMHGDGLVQPAHTCAECGREFITTSAYKLHMRKFHSVIITDEDINSVATYSGHE